MGIYCGAHVDKQKLEEKTVIFYRKCQNDVFPKSRSLDLLNDVTFKGPVQTNRIR